MFDENKKEQITRFLGELKSDSKLLEELKNKKNEGSAFLADFAKEKGFDFTAGEWLEYSQSIRKENAELGDSELAGVSGGGLFGECPKKQDFLLCIFSLCPHLRGSRSTPGHCALGYW